MESKPALPHADETIRMLKELQTRNPLPPPTGLRGLRAHAAAPACAAPSSKQAPAAALVMTRSTQPSADDPKQLSRTSRQAPPVVPTIDRFTPSAQAITDKVETLASGVDASSGSASVSSDQPGHAFMSARERFCTVNWERAVPTFDEPAVASRTDFSAKGRFMAVNWDRSEARDPQQRNQRVSARAPRASVDGLFSEIDW